jgi:hypothetical protein
MYFCTVCTLRWASTSGDNEVVVEALPVIDFEALAFQQFEIGWHCV